MGKVKPSSFNSRRVSRAATALSFLGSVFFGLVPAVALAKLSALGDNFTLGLAACAFAFAFAFELFDTFGVAGGPSLPSFTAANSLSSLRRVFLEVNLSCSAAALAWAFASLASAFSTAVFASSCFFLFASSFFALPSLVAPPPIFS